MSRPKRTFCSYRNGSSHLRGVLLFCMVAAAWRGPVPVLHAHSLDIGTIAASPQLREHAGKYHAEELDRGQKAWHWHFVMPSQPGHDHEEDDSCSCETMCAVGSTSASAVDSIHGSDEATLSIAFEMNTGRLQGDSDHHPRSGSFLSTYAESRPLLSILSVIRC